jgi:hypothetical protein
MSRQEFAVRRQDNIVVCCRHFAGHIITPSNIGSMLPIGRPVDGPFDCATESAS